MKAAVAFAMALAATAPLLALEPDGDALAAWDRCVAATETRFARDVYTERAAQAAPAVARVADGDPACDSPSGALIERWRGAVLVGGITVDELLRSLATELPRQEDVLAARFVSQADGRVRVALRLERHAIVTVVLDTEHDVAFDRRSDALALSRSVMTRVAEVADPGSPRERHLTSQEQRGFLWKMNAYSRYSQSADGVRIDMETITLSRAVPFLLRAIAAPIVEDVAREAMMRTLEGLRHRFERSWSK